ncbi:hypothetical protein [Paraflavitalea pollutisoli]|uniref:hypothetical protein n=1 Tax=Paraflavitalea pollutisoli TaxID=3034143 RepID=UPI0023EC01A3|nr:hypothetical protein [Paraflavitalea sp. H1-2-19X]
MKAYFTICSNNYLAYAATLGRSLGQHDTGTTFLLILCDEKHPDIDYSTVADEVIPIKDIEPLINDLAAKYNIIELNTCIKPKAFQYLLQERGFDTVIYLDPDIQVFDSLNNLDTALHEANILLTPHIYTPIPLDGKQPAESVFLNFGLYNLGFLAVRAHDEVYRFLDWWKERTYQQGYIDVYNGIFVDQLPVNFVPLFFKGVHILQDPGLNMAPWNLHERTLTTQGMQQLVNNTHPLRFFHFSSFNIDKIELPFARYNRYTLAQRPDLLFIYQEYARALQNAGHEKYRTIACVYDRKRSQGSVFNKLMGRK